MRILDMLQLSGVRQVARDGDGTSYYCDWQSEDYLNLVLSTIEELQPTQVVLLGFGSGVAEAMRSAHVLSILGQSVAGVVGVAPHGLTYKADEYREFVDQPRRLAGEIELHMAEANLLLSKKYLGVGEVSTCVRYEELLKPENGARTTFYVPQYVLKRQRISLTEMLTKVKTAKGDNSAHEDALIRVSTYKVPTAFIAPADSWYLPAAKVRALARRSKSTLSTCLELPGVCYDFRAYPSQVDRVTEAAVNKIGQLLTTGTVQQPRPARTLLRAQKVHAESPVGTIVLSSARPPYHHRTAVRLAKESKPT